ncbi:MAG: bifunctional diaminohydroxyphosphoribosylaminopyrimidine deaminase/5-amino-6-(5-phosphoribosylamino)uracil reductase RibD [Pseudomonadota bacterium]
MAQAPTRRDAHWMHLALGLARRRLGQVAPNPAVGAVIVRDGKVLGRGATAPGGRPHAEVVALDQARRLWGADALKGATIYVSLEPCAHHGKTPPCTDALIEAGISRVVASFSDPDQRVAGRGFAALEAAGLQVDQNVLADAARRLNVGFLTREATGRPWLQLKLATTLDGRIATMTGESRWLTGPAARRRVHLMRARADAVLIGAGTARIDDPMLDVRLSGQWGASIRVVADGSLSLPLTGRLASTAADCPLWVLHRSGAPGKRRRALADLGAETLEIAHRETGHLQMGAVLDALGARGLTRVMCEGGGQIAAALLRKDLVDEIALFTAGKLIGGDGLPAVRGFGLEVLDQAPNFTLSDLDEIEGDVLSFWQRTSGA